MHGRNLYKNVVGNAKSIVKYRDLYLESKIPRGRQLGIVYGNCQAEPIRRLISGSGNSEIHFVRIPPVHLISSQELAMVLGLMSRTALFVHQPVKSSYRALGAGTEELRLALPRGAVSVSFPVAYYRGLHPYQVYIRDNNGMNRAMSITGYHDLRFLVAAGKGMSLNEGSEWLERFETSVSGLKMLADQSIVQLQNREAKLDVSVSGYIDRSDVGSFFSVNHPCNRLLAAQASDILHGWDAFSGFTVPEHEFLGDDVSRIDGFIARANGSLQHDGVPANYAGKTYTLSELWAVAHNWYKQHPDVVDYGIKIHKETIKLLELV